MIVLCEGIPFQIALILSPQLFRGRRDARGMMPIYLIPFVLAGQWDCYVAAWAKANRGRALSSYLGSS